MADPKFIESAEDMTAKYGSPHTWDAWIWWINGWRLISENIVIRVFIDVALRCPDQELAAQARTKLGDTSIEHLDEVEPGRGDFVYDWEGVKRVGRRKRRQRAR